METPTKELKPKAQTTSLKALTEVSRALSASLDLEEVLNAIMDSMVERLGLERSTLTLLNQETGELMIEVARGLSDDEILRGKYRPGEGITGKVLETGEAMVVPDINKEPLFLDRTRARKGLDKSNIAFFCVPVKIGNETVGALSADRDCSAERDLNEDLRTLTIIASFAATAVRINHMVQEVLSMKAYNEDILRSMRQGVLTLDENGHVTSANKAALSLLGLLDPTVVGKPIEEVLASHKVLSRLLTKAVEEGTVYKNREVTVSTSESGPGILGLRTNPLTGPTGEKLGVLAVFEDMTEKKRLERAVRRSQRLAALGELAAGVAHEVRNPLAGIRMASQLLEGELAPEDSNREYTSVIIREADRLNRLVENLLEIAQPSGVTLEDTEVQPLLDRAVQLMETQIRSKSIKMQVEVEESLPQIRTDPEKILQVLLNLLLNAVEASPTGETLRIAAGIDTGYSAEGRRHVVIEVQDRGSGIPPDVQEHIFTPFFTTKEQGSGLGLPISHRIVEEHGGSLDFVSPPGGGATFFVAFPIPE